MACFCKLDKEPSNSEKQEDSDQLNKSIASPVDFYGCQSDLSQRGFFFCEQGAEGSNLDRKGSKGRLDEIKRRKIIICSLQIMLKYVNER
jgi:hypothetical protein